MAEGVVDTSHLPTCESCFFTPHKVLVCWKNMVATHIFHKLVFSARLFMKKASWGCCVLVFDSPGDPAVHPEVTLVLRVVPGLNSMLGVPHHVRRVLTPE